MSEAERFTTGQMPYRDFTWQYPPLGIWAAGSWAWLFGTSILSFQVFLTSVHGAVLLLLYAIFRALDIPARLALVGTFATALGTGISNHQRLFSLNTYTPAVPVLTFGAALLLYGLVRLWKGGGIGSAVALGIGGAVCVLSKLEWGIAGILTVMAAGAWLMLSQSEERSRRRNLFRWVCIAFVVPIVSGYLAAIIGAGFPNVVSGLVGYNQTVALPELWERMARAWRVEMPLFVFATLVSILFASGYTSRDSGRKIGGGFLGIETFIGLGIIALSGALSVWMLLHPGQILLFASELLNAGVWLSPAFLSGVCLAALGNRLANNPTRRRLLEMFVFVAFFLTGTQARCFVWATGDFFNCTTLTFFNWLLFFFQMEAVFGVLQFSHRFTANWLSAGFVGMFIIGLLLNYLVSRAPRLSLFTAHGIVNVPTNIGGPLSSTLAFVMATTRPDEPILSAPYGDSMNFLTGRKSPMWQTQLVRLHVPQRLALEDVQRLEISPPALVVVQDEQGAFLSEGASREANPQLWSFIDENYEPAEVFTGEKIRYKILRLKVFGHESQRAEHQDP
jgi:hypothetical protein